MTDPKAGYSPEARRPIAEGFRRTASLAVALAVRWGVSPNAISSASLLAAAGAGAALILAGQWHWNLLVAPVLMVLRLWFNMLDGMVALASGKASPIGELYNEIPDRLSDFVIFACLAHSGLAAPALAYSVAGAAIFVAYVGTLGQAVGVGRQFQGWMAKQWRMFALCVGCLGVFFLSLPGAVPMYLMDWVLVVILLGCAQTVWSRLRVIAAALSSSARATGE